MSNRDNTLDVAIALLSESVRLGEIVRLAPEHAEALMTRLRDLERAVRYESDVAQQAIQGMCAAVENPT